MLKGQATPAQIENRAREKRRMGSMMLAQSRKKHPKPTQADVDRSVAEFLAKGGQIRKVVAGMADDIPTTIGDTITGPNLTVAASDRIKT